MTTPTPTPQQRLARAFVELAGSVVTDPADPAGLLATLASHGTDLLGGRATIVLYVPDERSAAQLSGSDEELKDLERAAARWGEGPGHDARTTGRTVPDTALSGDHAGRVWPRYAPRALALGHRRAAALPLPVGNGDTGALGALTVLCSDDTPLSAEAMALAQSLTDAAGFALARDREVRASRVLADQLGHALTSRVVIEQAKGVVAAQLRVSVDEAFVTLRAHARSRQQRLVDVARAVVLGELTLRQGDRS